MKKIFLTLLVSLFAFTPFVIGAATGALPDIGKNKAVPIVGTKLCTASKSANGWEGTCRGSDLNFATVVQDPCDNGEYFSNGKLWEGNTEDLVGICDFDAGSVCCVPKGTALENPTKENYVSQFYATSACEALDPQASCEDVDANFLGGLAGTDPTCPSGKLAVGMCGSWEKWNGCCVPKDGEFCQKTEAAGGSCSGGAAAAVDTGTAAALEYGDYQLLESIPGSNNDASDLPSYLQNIYQAGLVLIVLGAIFMIGMGGFTYIASAGNTHTMAKGKGMIKDALYGLIIALATWLILNIINPDLVNLTIETPSTLDFTPSVDNEQGLDSGAAATAGGGGCAAIPDSQLVTFPAGSTDGKGTRRGTADTVKRFMAMRTAALKEGIDLRAGNAYRSPEEAEALWKSHGCQIVNGKTVCKGSLVAKPCSLGGSGSNHTRGTAIDIQTSTAGTNWMRKNAAQYGFYNKVASERWHWSDTGH